MLHYIELAANQTIDDLLHSLLIGHTYYVKDSTTDEYKYNEYVLVPKEKEYVGLAYDKDKVEYILIKELYKVNVKLTFTSNANTTVSVYFTKKSYDSNKPDDTISLTANQEKTTIYDRESIYKFTFNEPRAIASAKIEGALLRCIGLFFNCHSMQSLDVSKLDTSNVTDMGYMFSNCYGLTSLDLSHFDTSNVTDMRFMFNYCNRLTTLNISNFDTSKVTDMGYMFSNCYGLTPLDVSHFDTSNVTSMESMFEYCGALTTIGPVDTAAGWQHKPTDYKNMFRNCPATPKPSWYTAA